jgi:tetratricopeptide (TPR) repeat protein
VPTKRKPWLNLLFIFGIWSAAVPAFGQALIPHALELNTSQLEQQGLSLAQEAAQLAQFQQYELALTRAQLATQLSPKNYQAWFLLGGLYVQTNQLDKAVTALKQAQSLKPDEASIFFALGSAYFQQEKYDAAIASLRDGLKLKSDSPEALFDLGNAYYKLNQFPQALDNYEKAVKADAKFWPAINNIGLIKYEQGNVDAAVQHWQKALSIEKDGAEPKLAIAVALYTKGDREKALTLGEAAIKSDDRYADLEFLKQNLWGTRLLSDAQKFLATPRMQATIAQGSQAPSSEPQAPR